MAQGLRDRILEHETLEEHYNATEDLSAVISKLEQQVQELEAKAVHNQTSQDDACGTLIAGYNPLMGLGNKLFIYTSLMGLASLNRRRPVLVSPEPFEPAGFFHLDMDMPTGPPRDPAEFSIQSEHGCCNFACHLATLPCGGEQWVAGYFQSWRYFEAVKPRLLRQLTFREQIREKCDGILANITREGKEATGADHCLLISGHFRRGDFTREDKMAFGHSPATKEYMHAAVRYFRDKFTAAHQCIRFYLLSNDHQWLAENAPNGTDIVVIVPNEPVEDLCLLASANHSIMSTGSFGWWGAYLAGGEATVQKEYALPDTPHFSEYNPADFWLPHWHQI